MELASSVPEGLFGIGGSPGESVYIKAGAPTSEPTTVIDDQGWWRLTADKGNQANGGDDAVVIGTPANPNLDPETADGATFKLMTLDTTGLNLTATTDQSGTLWVFVGTDSGFEGTTTLYYNTIDVQLTRGSEQNSPSSGLRGTATSEPHCNTWASSTLNKRCAPQPGSSKPLRLPENLWG